MESHSAAATARHHCPLNTASGTATKSGAAGLCVLARELQQASSAVREPVVRPGIAHAAAIHLVPELLLVVSEGRRVEGSLGLEARWPDDGQAFGAVVQALDLNRQPARLVQHLRHEMGDTQRGLGNAALVEHGLAVPKCVAIARSHIGREMLNLVERDDDCHGGMLAPIRQRKRR